MAYTYHISFNNVDWSEFYPMSSNKITWVTEATEIFKRPNIDEIRIDGRRNATIYGTLKTNFEDDSTFGNYVYYKIKRNGTDTFFFIASINDGKLDKQNDIYYITPRPNDSYEKILKGYDIKRNITITDLVNIPIAMPGVFTDDGSGTWLDDGSNNLEWDNGGAGEQWAFFDISLGMGEQIIIIIKNQVINVGDTPTFYAVTAGGNLGSNVANIIANGKYILTMTAGVVRLRVSITGIGDGNMDYEIYVPDARSGARPLSNVIDDFLGVSHMDTGLAKRSTIIWNHALPSVKPPNIDAYITANPTNDYVLQSTAIWNYMVLAKGSAFAGTSADKYEMSFNDLMDMLKVKLRIFWYIDSDGFFRLEHERFFSDFASQLNVTALAGKPEVDKRVYTYEKSNIYQRITYSESNQGSADWLDSFTAFDAIKTTANIIDITPPQLSTDVAFMEAGTPANSGYALLQCLPSYLVDVNPSVITAGAYFPNVYLSWAWLRRNYFLYFSEADKSLAVVITYSGVKRFKKQVGIKFYYDGILNWLRPVTLAGGVGWIDKMELDLPTGFYTIDVGFDPYI